VTDEIMYEIYRLSDQEYVDVYADRRKRELADGDGSAAAVGGGDEREST
jgi:1-acyl-sn-glycerol-3-phosphate acyltransferase